MASLSNAFPAELMEVQSAQYIKAGAVIRLFCDFTTPPKHKYLMIASTEPLQVFIINSEIPEFIKRNKSLLADQVDIPQIDHQFLTHDSVLNCIEAHRAFDISHLKSELVANFSEVYKDTLRGYLLRTVIDVVEQSENLSRRIKTQIIQAIKQDNQL